MESEKRTFRPSWRFLAVAFAVGTALTAFAGYRLSWWAQASVLYSSFLHVGWRLTDLLGGDGYGNAHPGVLKAVIAVVGGFVFTLVAAVGDTVARLLWRGLPLRALSFMTVCAAFVVLFAAGWQRPLVLSFSSDQSAAADSWIGFAMLMEQRDTLGQPKAGYSSVMTDYFPDLLVDPLLPREWDMIILSAEFEGAWNPELFQGLEPLTRLADNPLVLATTDAAVAAALEQDPSLKATLQRVERGEWKLIHLDPAHDVAGLAALVLLARLQQPLVDKEGRIIVRYKRRQLVWRDWYMVPPARSWTEPEVAEVFKQPGTVAILDNARCGELGRAGVPLRGFFPSDGTLVFDHPVYLAERTDEQRREPLLHTISLLESPRGQRWKEMSMLGSRCAEGEPPAVLPSPPITQVRALIDEWKASQE